MPSLRSFNLLRIRREVADRLLVGVFLAAIALPMFGVLNRDVESQIRETERRKAAEFPELQLRRHGFVPFPKKRSLREFPPAFEAWFNDRLATRGALLQGYNLARVWGLVGGAFNRPAVGQEMQTPVIIGRDGWLFFGGGRMADYYRGTHPFSEDELDAWVRVLRARRDWLQARGIRYVFIVAPNKCTIYPEFMPRSLNKVRRTSRWDQLLERLRGPNGVDAVDLRSALWQAKEQRQAYHKIDSHWNDFGAYAAYRELMRHLRKQYPAAEAWPLDDFAIATSETEGGDLARMARSPFPFHDTLVRLEPKRTRRGGGRNVSESHGAESGRDVASELPGGALPRAVIVHDSFMSALSPLLNEHFRRARYRSTAEFPCELIEREKPAIVIEEMVERGLMNRHPRNPAAVRAFERDRR
jgi:alginate O-acetyltransferase complex protein AlgJ